MNTLEFKQGDTKLYAVDCDGGYQLTDRDEAVFIVRPMPKPGSYTKRAGDPVLKLELVPDLEDNCFPIPIASEMTIDLAPGKYLYECVAYYGPGSVKHSDTGVLILHDALYNKTEETGGDYSEDL